MSEAEKIRHFRRRVSNIAEAMKSMREFIDKQRSTPLTWQKVEKKVTYIIQQNVVTVDEVVVAGTKEETKVMALMAGPTMAQAMAKVEDNGGSVSFGAYAAVDSQQPRQYQPFEGRGGGRGYVNPGWGGEWQGHYGQADTTFGGRGGGRGGGGRGIFQNRLEQRLDGQRHVGPCRMWAAGSCTFGDDCKYLHGGGDGVDVRVGKKRPHED